MVLRLVELGEPPDYLVFFDGGWEWRQCVETVHRIAQETGIPLFTVRPTVGRGDNRTVVTFDFMLSEYRKTKGKRVGEHGYGWPSMGTRWCTKLKTSAIDRKARELGGTVLQIGFAADEPDRALGETINRKKIDLVYPLIEWGWDEKTALEYCYSRGYDWEGLYEIFPRVSCWCCPLQSNAEIQALHDLFPTMWAELVRKQMSIRDGDPRFKQGKTVYEWEARFR